MSPNCASSGSIHAIAHSALDAGPKGCVVFFFTGATALNVLNGDARWHGWEFEYRRIKEEVEDSFAPLAACIRQNSY
ncbi:hypothetical protein HBI73_155250 [Parastagonospora nodorum]|nr:hypothetical protein HBI06_244670 [Parastagonospora nodorum]KAH5084456.1 hypothetical protein HBI73_155250 [Parastagonospora nodorum]KAH5099179.1 hypothetical protein HBH71_235790 [Parastagonospora nodorum]KAH6263176.1 hypothetical protein HBI40_237020 [Parastagonospora nodorum]